MQLTKLRLSGFKSFVEPTELVLEPGLTGIVGPNGCGKSNIVDALKWVMGETSAKQLRGGEMDDVIFNGTQARPARNFAEVVLHLDNQLRKAPANFNDNDVLEVSRRIDRGEGSTYKVNARDVRQRDVQTIFADASTGAHSTAIVSQGRIGHLVNAKPTERRAFLEEAAGIVGLHARRHEAELRLNAAENNIKRSEDILRQMNEQLVALKKQAKQAAAYKSLADRFRQTEALFFHHQWQDVVNRLSSAQERKGQIDGELTGLESELTAVNAQQAELAGNIPALRQKEAERAAALQRLKLAEHELSGEESRLAAAQMALEQRIAQIQNDLEREKQLAEDARKNIETTSAEQAEISAIQNDQQQSVANLLAEFQSRETEQKSAETSLQDLSDRIGREETRWSALEERKNQLQSRLTRLGEDLSKSQTQRDEWKTKLDADNSLQLCLQAVVFNEAEVSNAKTKLADAEQNLQTAQTANDDAQKQSQEFNAGKAKLRAEADGLRAILSSESDIVDPIMDQVRVQTGFEAALSAALGDDLFAGLQDSADRFWRGLPPFASAPELPHGANPLNQMVDAPKELTRALSLVGVVENFESGQLLQNYLSVGQCLVSKNGDLWRFDGYTAKAQAAQKTAAHLRHKNRLEEVSKELENLSTEETRIAQLSFTAQQNLVEAKERQQTSRTALDTAYNELQTARGKQSDETQRIAVTQAQYESAQQNCDRLTTEQTETKGNFDNLISEMGEKPDFDAMRADQSQKRLNVEELRNQTFQARAAYEQSNNESKQRETRLQQLDNQLRDWQKRLTEVESRQTMLSERQETAIAEQQELAEKPAEFAAQREQLLIQITGAEESRNEAADILSQAEAKLSEVDKAARALQNNISVLREERVKHQTAIELGDTEQQKLRYDIQERLESSPEQLLEIAALKDPADMPDFVSTQNKLERLRRERDNMGPVNLRADIEATEVEEKLTKQQSEHDELIAATAKLRTGINELNKEGRERLTEAFVKVNENFSRLFTRLFGGGKAYLEWTEHEDPLEAGLEIYASPPGKKLQALSLLSGGERALTAIALLFAVFECNPAPICVLDEVDAPLDESNVDRYCTMLEEMAKRNDTRYVVITHHRMTMARMHRLFGVTMGEAGVSQLVSVDLHTAEKMRATA